MHNIYCLYIMDAEQKQTIAEKEEEEEITPMNVPPNLEGRDIYIMYLGGEGAAAEAERRRGGLRSSTTGEEIGIGENRLWMKVKVIDMRIYPPQQLYLDGDILQPPQLAGTRAEFVWPRDRFSLKPFTSLVDLAGKYKRRQQLASFKKRAGIWKEAYDKSAFLPGFPEHGVTAGVEVREAERRFDQLTGKVPERPCRPQRPDEPDEYYRKQQLRYSSFPDAERRERYREEQGKTVERAKRRQLRLKAAVKRRRTQRRGGRRGTRGRRKRAKRSRKRGRKRRRTGRRKRRW